MTQSTDFRISGLSMESFRELFRLTDAELTARNARMYIADADFGFPCRVSLKDATIGERVVLLPYTHHSVEGPYHSSGPIFIRENAEPPKLGINEIPDVARIRLLSIRAYDSNGWMLQSLVAEGPDLAPAIHRMFEEEKIAYLHLHNAKPGCFSCRVDRA